MAKKSITIVAGSMNTAKTLRDQLAEYLTDQVVHLCAIEDGVTNPVVDDLVLLSSVLTKEDLVIADCFCHDCENIIAGRMVNYDFIDQIVDIPPGTPVLLVNDLMETAEALIDNLEALGLDHLRYTPYCPGMPLPIGDFKIAITPGESDKVPSNIEMIYDIGPRLLDFTTVTQVLIALDIFGEQAGLYSQAYLEKIIRIAKRLAASRLEVEGLNDQLHRVIDGLKEGLMVYRQDGIIQVMNDYACQLLGVRQQQVIGKRLKSVLQHKGLVQYLYEPLAADADGVTVLEIEGYMVSLVKMQSKNGDIVVSLKRPDLILEENRAVQQELARKGFTAKYGFSDIIGDSETLVRAKVVCGKLAKSDLTILLHGESGTGKELFASAIHRASRRKMGPFLAINFSALPDELIESELFGYEEGAFTGAKKGGKSGLFEQADGGTLFLDEIGDISPKVQARLLRVLQEGEIMRIGAQEIKRVDVRVVAATNKDLSELVSAGAFREDLYYRLQMGYVYLPPLRKRFGDIEHLIPVLLRNESMTDMHVSKEVLASLMGHSWPGNVRELKNCIRYMCAMADTHELTAIDLPEYLKEKELLAAVNGAQESELRDGRLDRTGDGNERPSKVPLTEEEVFILSAVQRFEVQKEPCGREKLAAFSAGTAYEMTKYQMRTRLEQLAQSGYVTLGRGKVGVHLTTKGKNTI